MIELAVAVLGLAATGVAFVAYNHPGTFARLHFRLAMACWALAALMFGWNISGWLVLASVERYVAAKDQSAARAAAEATLFDPVYAVGLTVFSLYVWAAFMVSRSVHKQAGDDQS